MTKHWSAVIAFVMLVAAGSLASAQDMPVPLEQQAALFKKVFTFDKFLANESSITMLVIASDAETKEKVVAAFKGVGIDAVGVKLEEAQSKMDDAAVVYVCPGVVPPKSLFNKFRVLSISGVPAFAKSGQVSIAMAAVEGKPKVIVHMGQLKAEGHDLSADMLKLASVDR